MHDGNGNANGSRGRPLYIAKKFPQEERYACGSQRNLRRRFIAFKNFFDLAEINIDNDHIMIGLIGTVFVTGQEKVFSTKTVKERFPGQNVR